MTQTACPTVNELVLQKIKFAITLIENCYPQDLRYDTEKDIMRDRIIHAISWNLLGKDIETRKYPSTWWDAFKDRWFPKFLKKRFPVNWEEFKLYNICPHINHAWPENRNMHILWIEGNHGFNIHAEAKE